MALTFIRSIKRYVGYSTILYDNLVATFVEFQKSVDEIKYKETESGHYLFLSANANRGGIQIHFNNGDLMPSKVVRFKSDTTDFVTLSFSAIRLDNILPSGYFRVPSLSSTADSDIQVANLSPDPLPNRSLLSVGTQAPDWDLLNANGQHVRLSALKGKVVLMDFWATWCAPCIQTQPLLQRIHEKYSDVVVLGMDYHEKKDVDLNAYKARKKIKYEMISHAEGIGSAYKISVLPTAYLIDRSGTIVYTSRGYGEDDEGRLIKAIESALSK